jgi:hypothetical protein
MHFDGARAVTLPRFHVQQLTLLFVRSCNRTVSGNRSTNGCAGDCKILRSNRLYLGAPARVFRTDIATFCSTFRVLKKLSIGALSQAFARRLIDIVMWY